MSPENSFRGLLIAMKRIFLLLHLFKQWGERNTYKSQNSNADVTRVKIKLFFLSIHRWDDGNFLSNI